MIDLTSDLEIESLYQSHTISHTCSSKITFSNVSQVRILNWLKQKGCQKSVFTSRQPFPYNI